MRFVIKLLIICFVVWRAFKIAAVVEPPLALALWSFVAIPIVYIVWRLDWKNE